MKFQFSHWRQRHMTPWRWTLTGIVLAELLWLAAPPYHGLVESWYSLWIYPAISGFFVALQDRMPIPVTTVLIVVLLLALGLWIRWQWKALRDAGTSRWWIVPRFAWVAAQGIILFVLWVLIAWGAGYQRTPVTERWSLDNANLNPEESVQLRSELLAVIQQNADAVGTQKEAVASIAEAMGRLLVRQGDGGVRVPRQVRATPPGLFLVFSTSGMCVPGAIEPFADGAYDDITFIQVAAHELAHVAGYNRESEATLVGYMAGLAADDPLARYAVALNIYMDLLVRIQDEEARDAAWSALPARAQEDYLRGREIGAKYRVNVKFLQQMGYRVYDTYLKSQGIEEGMENYSTGLRLFAGAWRNGLVEIAPRRSGEEAGNAKSNPALVSSASDDINLDGVSCAGGVGEL